MGETEVTTEILERNGFNHTEDECGVYWLLKSDFGTVSIKIEKDFNIIDIDTPWSSFNYLRSGEPLYVKDVQKALDACDAKFNFN